MDFPLSASVNPAQIHLIYARFRKISENEAVWAKKVSTNVINLTAQWMTVRDLRRCYTDMANRAQARDCGVMETEPAPKCTIALKSMDCDRSGARIGKA
jgi:ABC-type nickel/cobalt efflux system permease component RcnA